MAVQRFTFKKVNAIEGLQIITPFMADDDRGMLTKVYEQDVFQANNMPFSIGEIVETHSHKGVLRGLHMQRKAPQGKLVRVVNGRIYDVAVDVRKDSKTFGKYYGIELSKENKKMFYIPAGFLHGVLALEDNSVFNYLCTNRYFPEYDGGVCYNDPDIGIDWPVNQVDELILSDKDKMMPSLQTFAKLL